MVERAVVITTWVLAIVASILAMATWCMTCVAAWRDLERMMGW